MSQIEKAVFALIYINVVINPLLFGSRVLLFNPYKEDADGEEAVKFRLSTFGPRVLQSLASLAFIVLVVWIEPTQCGPTQCVMGEGWFAKIGGHFLFH